MTGFDVRPVTPEDAPEVLDLLSASLGWIPDAQYAAFFDWKHRQSPFGESPAWVATVDGEVVGFRTFMRWEFVHDGAIVRAVRAVDTATHPDHRGRGIFAALTEHAVDALRRDGVAFVFNTPNDQSRPGYLKMGWQVVGRLPVAVRPRDLRTLPRLLRSRTAADKWSTPTTVGEPVGTITVAPSPTTSKALHTNRTTTYLRWRYGFAPLAYRVLTRTDADSGAVVFRLRRRGPALEAAVCDELAPSPALVAEMLGATQADYAIRVGTGTARMLRLPGLGPILTCRPLAMPALERERWDLHLGDVELF